MPAEFDVFLSHNTRDKPLVQEIGARLRGEGLSVWLDKWELRPGFPWQEGIEEGVQESRAVAVFVGLGGLGAWQAPEMRAFIARSRHEQVPVIPVLLPDCPDSPQLNLFLEAFAWVDLREGLTEDGLARLIWGITGKKPEGMETVAVASSKKSEHAVAGGGRRTAGAGSPGPLRKKPRRIWWNLGIALGLLGIVATIATWQWPVSPKPMIYAVRVQVLDPQGQPVSGSTIRTSAGNEPHLLPDGWWEVQIPAAKVPSDGLIALWAAHEAWEGNHVELRLGKDTNPRVEIRLKTPETWLRGRVVDQHERTLSGVRVSRDDGGPGEPAITDGEGRFALKLSVPREARVWLRSELAGSAPGRDLCYAGRDSCSIVLEKR
ncbi:MAG TPA: TIR domain-containing protein [Thermoanaerobaculia bacterium]|jgi:hypothetical protein|nr:TIR domain-containing protein [Thermoanaerobaculia bacterium]